MSNCTTTHHEEHDRHADETITVDQLPVCESQRCTHLAGYMYHTLYTEPAYCADHLAVPPYIDQTYAKLAFAAQAGKPPSSTSAEGASREEIRPPSSPIHSCSVAGPQAHAIGSFMQ